jgi:hypothetical protein
MPPRYNNGNKIGVQNVRTRFTGKPGMWTMDEMKVSPNSPPDPFFANVSMLAHFEVTDFPWIAGVTFPNVVRPLGQGTDFSLKTVSDCALNTDKGKWGTSSLYNDGGTANRSALATGHAGYTFGTGDFTVECWANFDTPTTGAFAVDMRPPSVNGWYVGIGPGGGIGGKLTYFANNIVQITGTTVLTAAVWHHIAVARNAGNTRLYMDGNQEGSTLVDANSYGASSVFMSGGAFANSPCKGYFNDLRITKGVARYTGTTYTIPSARFSDV